jgi:hypothetical protein
VTSTSIITRSATVAMAAAGLAARVRGRRPVRLTASAALAPWVPRKPHPSPPLLQAIDLERAVVELSAGGTP